MLLLFGVAAVANLKFHLGLVGGYDRLAVAGIFIAGYVALLRLGAFTSAPPQMNSPRRIKAILTVTFCVAVAWFFELGPYFVKNQPIPDRSWWVLGVVTAVTAFVTFRVLRSLGKPND